MDRSHRIFRKYQNKQFKLFQIRQKHLKLDNSYKSSTWIIISHLFSISYYSSFKLTFQYPLQRVPQNLFKQITLVLFLQNEKAFKVLSLVSEKERQQFKQHFAAHSFYNQYFPQVVLMSSALVSYRSQHTVSHSVASFLLKTFEILEKAQFEHIISWTYDDDTFAIKNIIQFTNQVLPKYFRHRNFSSFVRQLNMYDFHKIKQSNDFIVFRNPLFKKGQSHLLKKIKRKAPKKNQLEKKISSTIGIQRQEENNQLRQSLEVNIQESTLTFQKSLLSLETIYSLISKNQSLFKFIDLSEPERVQTSRLLDKIRQVQKLSNISFKSISTINHTIGQCLKQKQIKYSHLSTNQYYGITKNVSTGSHTSEIKSSCSIGDHNQEI